MDGRDNGDQEKILLRILVTVHLLFIRQKSQTRNPIMTNCTCKFFTCELNEVIEEMKTYRKLVIEVLKFIFLLNVKLLMNIFRRNLREIMLVNNLLQ